MARPEKTSEPKPAARRSGSPAGAASTAIRQVVLGGGLLLAAFLLWEVRDLVPLWAAESVTVNIELSTTTERDDARVTRAFETAMQTAAADAMLEPLPNQTKVRHTRVTVRAASSAEAVAQATALAQAMADAFTRAGGDTLLTDVRRRTRPVPDRTTAFLGYALQGGAAIAGILGLALIAVGWFRGEVTEAGG